MLPTSDAHAETAYVCSFFRRRVGAYLAREAAVYGLPRDVHVDGVELSSGFSNRFESIFFLLLPMGRSMMALELRGRPLLGAASRRPSHSNAQSARRATVGGIASVRAIVHLLKPSRKVA